MKNFLLSLVTCIVSCGITFLGLTNFYDTDSSSNKEEVEEIVDIDPSNIQFKTDINAKILERNYRDWSTYNKNSIELSYNFRAIDVNEQEISKEEFLTKLKEGIYIPLKVKGEELTYKLHRLGKNADSKIGGSIASIGSIFYNYYQKERTPFPEFNFRDLDNIEYSTTSTNGKIKVIKCWFIHCTICVEEFPKLNKLYDLYEVDENLVFISLAFDDADKLKDFLSNKEFRYPVIPNQKDFMNDELGVVKQYPTHIIVDQDNNIYKMVNNVNALTGVLNTLTGRNVTIINDSEEEEIKETEVTPSEDEGIDNEEEEKSENDDDSQEEEDYDNDEEEEELDDNDDF